MDNVQSRSNPICTRLDTDGNQLCAGGVYRLMTGGNAVMIEVNNDLSTFSVLPSWFACFFKVEALMLPLNSLPGHCRLELFVE
jgi:hypothetical protein